jgi:hypothetical protein
MKHSKFKETQSVAILKEADSGVAVKEVCHCDLPRTANRRKLYL